MWLNLYRVKPAGVAVGVLWGWTVWTLPGLRSRFISVSGRLLERVAVVGESPVRENTGCGLGLVPE
jgi:hypothetical protein